MSRAMRLTESSLLDLRERIAGRPTTTQMRDQPAERRKRGQKYGNTKVDDRGLVFDSKAEHRRWLHLELLQRAGEISGLRRQVPYELIPGQARPSGGRERPTVYLADFVYRTKGGSLVVEDVKGAVTPEFRLKRKLMLHVHGIEVQEVRS